MVYTLKTSTSDLYRFPTFATRDEAAALARRQVRADIVALGIEGYSEAEYTDDGDISAYRIMRTWNHNATGFHAGGEVGRVEIIEV